MTWIVDDSILIHKNTHNHYKNVEEIVDDLNDYEFKLSNCREAVLYWRNENELLEEENKQLKKQLKELNKYCTACDDTLTTILELTYKLLTVDFKDTETKADYCHLLNEMNNKDLSFIHDCIKAISKCDIIEMEELKKEYMDWFGMSKYEYWKCSEREDKEGFGVKDISINRYYAGEEVIDLINSLNTKLELYKSQYEQEKEKKEHYKAVLTDLIDNEY